MMTKLSFVKLKLVAIVFFVITLTILSMLLPLAQFTQEPPPLDLTSVTRMKMKIFIANYGPYYYDGTPLQKEVLEQIYRDDPAGMPKPAMSNASWRFLILCTSEVSSTSLPKVNNNAPIYKQSPQDSPQFADDFH